MVFDSVYDKATAVFPEAETIAVDAGYKTPWICKKVQDDGRNISTPYKRPMGKTGFFFPHEYVYDEYFDCVLCPENQVLPYSTTNRDGYKEFKSDPSVCVNCPSKQKCTMSSNNQKVVVKHIWADYIEAAEDFRHSPAGYSAYKMRGQTIERVFADAKEKHGMRYTMLRGLGRVDDWITMKFTAMNLKKLAMWAW
jgi:transcription elongation factor Elf1